MRIATYNIHQWERLDRSPSQRYLSRAIKNLDADFIGMQEVFNPLRRGGRDTKPLEELAGSLRCAYAFGKNEEFPERDPGGHYGNAVLTRHRIVSTRNYWLPCAISKNSPKEEQRGLLEVIVEVSSGLFSVFVTHLDSTRGDHRLRNQQARRILEITSLTKHPHGLIGDFNAHLDDEPVRLILESDYRDVFEFANTPFPKNRIDFIFLPKSGRCRAKSASIIDDETTKKTSDHLPLVADLEWS